MDIRKNADFMALWAYTHAARRGKTRNDMTYEEIYNGIKEELADIILACMTELCKECIAKNNGYNPADVLVAKNEYKSELKKNKSI